MKPLTYYSLLASLFTSCSLAQVLAPSLTCPKGYSATTGSGPSGVCATGQNQTTCIAAICEDPQDGTCVTVDNNLYCSACCVDMDYFIFPSILQSGTATYNIGDTLDVIFISNTATPNGVSTNCTCNNPPGQTFSQFNETVRYGVYNGADDFGTSVGFNTSITDSCSQLKTLCYLQLHAFDGFGENGWGTVLATTYDFNLDLTAGGGSVIGSLPIVQSTTTTSASASITSASITNPLVGGLQTTASNSAPTSTATGSVIKDNSPNGISTGGIAGIAVGGLGGLAIIGLVAYLLWRREMRRLPQRQFVSDPYEPHMQQPILQQEDIHLKPYNTGNYRSELPNPTPEMAGHAPDFTPELIGSSPRSHYNNRFST